MIVVVGQPQFRGEDSGAIVDGISARIALAAAARGRVVQLVGKVGEDAEGDAVVLALARGAVGHAALLRDAGIRTPQARVPIDAQADGLEADADHGPKSDDSHVVSIAGSTDAADVELALRYLTNFTVVVLAVSADAEMARVVAAAASWADACVIAVVPAGAAVPEALPADAIVFEAPHADPDGVFAAMVGSFAAALDDGDDPAAAFRSTVAAEGWTAATDSK